MWRLSLGGGEGGGGGGGGGDKTISDSVDPRLESFYPPFVVVVGVVDSYLL